MFDATASESLAPTGVVALDINQPGLAPSVWLLYGNPKTSFIDKELYTLTSSLHPLLFSIDPGTEGYKCPITTICRINRGNFLATLQKYILLIVNTT